MNNHFYSRSRLIATLLTILCVLTVGCHKKPPARADAVLTQPGGVGTVAGYSAWAAYWDSEDVPEELEKLSQLDTLCYFAASFDEHDRLVVPENTLSLLTQVREKFPDAGWRSYLTIVNDLALADGGSSLKDTELVRRLLGTPESRRTHALAIVALARTHSFDGIEIDYERLGSDMELWGWFLDFCEELQQLAQEAGLWLRVTLESSAPYQKLHFPAGPDYAIMCYNLYGTHSGPGPKADPEFLASVRENTAGLPGTVDYALATGGFDWPQNGKAVGLTEQQAHALAEQHGIQPARDTVSGCLNFAYIDTDGSRHTVWYADVQTLRLWQDVLSRGGNFKLSYWRLGGNMTLAGAAK